MSKCCADSRASFPDFVEQDAGENIVASTFQSTADGLQI